MPIPPWTPEAAPRDAALVDAIRQRRGGELINLDRALLWSAPLARGWNAHLGAIRRELSVDARLREIAICVVARLTRAEYEFLHHWPEYVRAGGPEANRPRLDDPEAAAHDPMFTADERLAMRLALAMTRDIRVPRALEQALENRFSATERVELIATIATYNMVARFLVATGVQPESDN